MLKTITLCAEEKLIQAGQRRASNENTTLDALFSEWLKQYVNQPSAAEQYDALMRKLSMHRANRKFSRDEMNERR